MDIRSINQGGQPALELNVSATKNTQNVSEVKPEENQANTTYKSEQQNDDYQSSNGQRSLTEKDVKKAIDKLNKLLEDNSTHAEYEIYGKFKDITIKIVNNKTKEVVQELPPKKIIDMVDKLCELAGMFVDKKA